MNPNDRAAKKAWKPQNNQGAKNKNVNSIGSVIPVKNEVAPAEATNEAAIFLFSFGAAVTIAAAAAGKPNIMNGYLPCMYCPALTPAEPTELTADNSVW
jgi:hypothetical protein